MNHRKYTIGVDYGTESGRAILVDVRTGEELAVHVTPYPHGVYASLVAAGKEEEAWPSIGKAAEMYPDYVAAEYAARCKAQLGFQ